MLDGIEINAPNGRRIAFTEPWSTSQDDWREINCGCGCGAVIKEGDIIVNYPPPFGFNILSSFACFERELAKGKEKG